MAEVRTRGAGESAAKKTKAKPAVKTNAAAKVKPAVKTKPVVKKANAAAKAKPVVEKATGTAKAKAVAKRVTVPGQEIPALPFETQQAWGVWLAENHGRIDGVWIVFAKKSSGIPTVTYHQALEEALIWGWIDGQSKSRDASTYLQRFTPRRARSIWSKINRDKALALIASGRMQPPGLAEVERAQKDGRWDQAYDSPKNATVPPDLAAALAAEPRAQSFFATLNSANRYAVLHRVLTAKKPETRTARIEKLVAMLARGEKFHP